MTTTTDVSTLLGAVFYQTLALYPTMADNAVSSVQKQLDTQNDTLKSQFANVCAQWLNDGVIARNAGAAIPPKPVAPLTKVVARQDIQGGLWLAEVDGPPVGVCPDLPAPPAVMTKLPSPIPTSNQPTMDQKLDAVASMLGALKTSVDAILATLKAKA